MKDKTSLNAVATPVVSMSKYLNYVLDSYYTYDNDNQKLRFIMEHKTENCLITEKYLRLVSKYLNHVLDSY